MIRMTNGNQPAVNDPLFYLLSLGVLMGEGGEGGGLNSSAGSA